MIFSRSATVVRRRGEERESIGLFSEPTQNLPKNAFGLRSGRWIVDTFYEPATRQLEEKDLSGYREVGSARKQSLTDRPTANSYHPLSYGNLFIEHLMESPGEDSKSNHYKDGVPTEGVKAKDVFSRIAKLHLIHQKVVQTQASNRNFVIRGALINNGMCKSLIS